MADGRYGLAGASSPAAGPYGFVWCQPRWENGLLIGRSDRGDGCTAPRQGLPFGQLYEGGIDLLCMLYGPVDAAG